MIFITAIGFDVGVVARLVEIEQSVLSVESMKLQQREKMDEKQKKSNGGLLI